MGNTPSHSESDSRSSTIVVATFYSVFIIIGVVTNLYLAILILVKRRFWKTDYIYIAQLNLSATLFLLFGIVDMISDLNGIYIFSEQTCKITSWFLESILNVQMLMITCLTYERYITVFQPRENVNNVIPALIKSFLFWIGAFTFGMIYYAYTAISYTNNYRTCSIHPSGKGILSLWSALRIIFMYFIPITMVIYGCIKFLLWRRNSILKKIYVINGRMPMEEEEGTQHKEFMDLTLCALLLDTVFISAMIPFLGAKFIFALKVNDLLPRGIWTISIILVNGACAIICLMANRVLLREAKNAIGLKWPNTNDLPGNEQDFLNIFE